MWLVGDEVQLVVRTGNPDNDGKSRHSWPTSDSTMHSHDRPNPSLVIYILVTAEERLIRLYMHAPRLAGTSALAMSPILNPGVYLVSGYLLHRWSYNDCWSHAIRIVQKHPAFKVRPYLDIYYLIKPRWPIMWWVRCYWRRDSRHIHDENDEENDEDKNYARTRKGNS